MLEGDEFFLGLLLARGGSTSISTSGPSDEVQAMIDQGLCTVSIDPESEYKTVTITEHGRSALRALWRKREIEAKLSFQPQFHRYVELGELNGWSIAIPPFGSVMSFAAEIADEQRRIEAEGEKIITIDFKHAP